MSAGALEKLFTEPSRLAILCELVNSGEPIDFPSLRNACSLTDGNLNKHLEKLADAKVVKITKKFVDKKPKTLIALTAKGREDFAAYVKELEAVLKGAAKKLEGTAAEVSPRAVLSKLAREGS